MDETLFGSDDDEHFDKDYLQPQKVLATIEPSASMSSVLSPINENKPNYQNDSTSRTPLPIVDHSKSLIFRPHPESNKRLILAKLPSSLSLACEPVVQFQSNNSEPPYTIQSKLVQSKSQNLVSLNTSNGENQEQTIGNTNLIEWNDGSFSLFVGDHIYDCEIQNDPVHLFEDSFEDIKPLHCVVNTSLQIRQSNIIQKGIKPFLSNKQAQQKTQLITFNQAEDMQLVTQKALENRRDVERMKRKQINAAKDVGLTGSFLESDEDL